jgi:hypothetical protein
MPSSDIRLRALMRSAALPDRAFRIGAAVGSGRAKHHQSLQAHWAQSTRQLHPEQVSGSSERDRF